jgi:predicted ATPase
LRQYRVAAGQTQQTHAERARMSLAAIGKLERGARQRPYRATIALLGEALSLSPDDRLELERSAGRGVNTDLRPEQDVRPAINLPIDLSSFIGREQDLAKIHEMLANHRLVTLVGAGGVGKTRLAVRAAEHFIAGAPAGDQFDGAWLVDFSSVAEDEMVLLAIASSIGIARCGTIDALITYLETQAFLLILDNCEHVLDPIAHTVKALLSGCPGARILGTSRKSLSVDGERIYRVPPLSVPPGDTLSADEALNFDAIRLFADRAEATDSRFKLTDSVVPAVAEICRRADGIALAIELAAARTNALSATTIARQIGEHFALLGTGARTALPRHQTMRSLFDWSYNLLDDREREVFRRSSVFANGFTLDLLCALYAEDPEQGEISGLLASLVDQSFVQCDINKGPRYRLLEPARQYAREKLINCGDDNRTARSHALALIALAEDFDSRLELIPDRVWDEFIARERDNFHAAFDWALGPHGEPALGQRLAASMSAIWSGFQSGEVRKWVSVAFTPHSETTPPKVQAKLAISAARSAIHFERSAEARVEACRHALTLQHSDDLRALTTAQYYLGLALGSMGRYEEADTALREAREAARSSGAQNEYNVATRALGVTRSGIGDLREARELVSEALLSREVSGSERGAADARVELAEIEFASGSVEEALQLNECAAQFFRSHSNLRRLPITLCNSSAYLIALERYQEAWEHAHEAMRRSRAIGNVDSALWAMQHLAAIAVFGSNQSGNSTAVQRAAKILGFVDESARQRAKYRPYTERQEYEKMLSTLRVTFGEAELDKHMAVGRAWPEEQAVAEALGITV